MSSGFAALFSSFLSPSGRRSSSCVCGNQKIKEASRINDCDEDKSLLINDIDHACEAWLLLDQDCRAVIRKYFAQSAAPHSLLSQVEHVCLHFVFQKRSPSRTAEYGELMKYLVHPISVNRAGTLVMAFHEEHFLERLLVRGVARFYGLESRCVQDKSNNIKYCFLEDSKSIFTPLVVTSTSGLSLVNYLARGNLPLEEEESCSDNASDSSVEEEDYVAPDPTRIGLENAIRNRKSSC